MYIYCASIFTIFMTFFGCQKSHSSDDEVKKASIIKKSIVKSASPIFAAGETENPHLNVPTASNLSADSAPAAVQTGGDSGPADSAPADSALAPPIFAAGETENPRLNVPTAILSADSAPAAVQTDNNPTVSIINTGTTICEKRETTISTIGNYAKDGLTVSCGETVTWAFDSDTYIFSITVESGGTLNITKKMSLNGALTNAGTITIRNTTGYGLYTAVSNIINTGTITISNTAGIGLFNSEGTIENKAGGTITSNIIHKQTDTGFGLYNDRGTINNFGTITLSSTYGIGLYIDHEGTINNSSIITVSGTGGKGLYIYSGSINNKTDGTITIDGIGGDEGGLYIPSRSITNTGTIKKINNGTCTGTGCP